MEGKSHSSGAGNAFPVRTSRSPQRLTACPESIPKLANASSISTSEGSSPNSSQSFSISQTRISSALAEGVPFTPIPPVSPDSRTLKQLWHAWYMDVSNPAIVPADTRLEDSRDSPMTPTVVEGPAKQAGRQSLLCALAGRWHAFQTRRRVPESVRISWAVEDLYARVATDPGGEFPFHRGA